MDNIAKIYVGVDIGKYNLDIHLYPLGKSFKIGNNEPEIKKILKELKKYNIEQIGCEASGGYEKLLAELLKKQSKNIWIIDPRRIKGFITASGCRSKTDKIDAKKIAEFLSQNAPKHELINKTENEAEIQSLINRKQDLVKVLTAEKTRLKNPSHASSIKSIKRFIKILNAEIKTIDLHVQKIVKSCAELAKKSQILESIPGIGKATASILMSYVHELGKISNSEASALIGVCPYDNESGTYKGKRFIKGGRPVPRNALYMSALTSIKHNLLLKEIYNRLRAANKPFKVAIVAVMHKLVILANSLLKRGELCKI